MQNPKGTPAGSAGLAALANLIESKSWHEAWREVRRQLEDGIKSPRLLLMGSHASFGERDLASSSEEARDALYRAHRLAKQALSMWTAADGLMLLGKIRFHLGTVSREVGDLTVALDQFDAFLAELPEKYPELAMGEGKAHLYRGLVLRQQRRFDEALEAYQHAATLFRQEGLPGLLCRANQNAAWLLCMMDDAPDHRALAWICLQEAAPLIREREERWHQTLGEALLCEVEGQYPQAARLCHSLFAASLKEQVSDEVLSQAALIAGQIAVGQCDLRAAASLTTAALQYAAVVGDSRLINDAQALRAEIVCLAGEAPEAYADTQPG